MSEPTVALLYALDAEGAPFLESLEDARAVEEAGRRFFLGSIGGVRVVVAPTGVGKVASATAAAIALSRFRAGALLTVGAAGALSSQVRVGDLVLASHLVQHDLGVREGRRASPSESLRRALRACLDAERPGGRVLEGTILTGDKACLGLRRRLFLRYGFRRDRPLAVDMESAAAAVVAEAAGAPHAVLRVATDHAGPFALAEFKLHYPRLAPLPAEVIVAWLRRGAAGIR